MSDKRGWVLGAASVAVGLTFAPEGSLWRVGAAILLLWGLPAVSWAWALGGDWLRGVGLAYVGSGLATLTLVLLPGPFPAGWARMVYWLLAVLPAWRVTDEEPFRWVSWKRAVPWLAVAMLALAARGINLSYSEFQGDEAVIMQRAAQAIAGNDEVLFLHQKGPVEILTPLALWSLTGTVNEWQARLPFTLAGVWAVLAVAALAEAWFGRRAGWFAGALLAINGLLVAFGRIVQYQNLVVLMGALGLLSWSAYLRHGKARDGFLGAVFWAYGLLAHYDAVLIAPAVGVLLGCGLWSRRAQWRRSLWHLAVAGLLGAAVLGVFYVPFVLNPMFERTFAYLSAGRVGGGGLFHNSASSVWVMSLFYTSLYYVLGLIVLLLTGVGLTWREVRRGKRLTVWGAAWLYFLTPWFFYTFIVIDPRTHIYTMYPGAAVLAGAVLSSGWAFLRARGRWAVGAALAVGVWYVLCAGYVGLAFVSHQPEYKREWPASRHLLYPEPRELPPYGYFGFPYRAGWKAVAVLYDQGVLRGTYASNEEPEVTTWYVRHGQRTMCDQPDTYIIAAHVQDEIEIDWEELRRDYHLTAQVTVAGQPKIAIYQRTPSTAMPLILPVADAVASFDAGTTVAAQVRMPERGAYPVGADFGDVARLLGYDLSATQLHPGDTLIVTLHWQALTSPKDNYQVFTHLLAGGELVAQHDGAPACAHHPTSLWEQGEYVRDEHVIHVGPDVPPGKVTLEVGMYNVVTLVRLPLISGGDHVVLRELDVVPR